MTASGRRRYQFRDYLNRRVLTMLALGFSSGLPFLLVGNTFGFWLSDEGTSLTAIGFISWVGLTYTLKFLWSPLLDRLDIPGLAWLGRRRGWMVATQIVVGAGLFCMAISGTAHGLVLLGALALVVAFGAATQDIAIDAWRIESAATTDELGLLTSGYTLGFRIALLCTDSLILVSAQHLGWPASYTICGALMGIGLLASLLAREPARADAVNQFGLPALPNRAAVAALVGIAPSELAKLMRPGVGSGSGYVEFEIAKAKGGTRRIAAPRKPLRIVQREILDQILAKVPVHEACHGFVTGRSTVTNESPAFWAIFSALSNRRAVIGAI